MEGSLLNDVHQANNLSALWPGQRLAGRQNGRLPGALIRGLGELAEESPALDSLVTAPIGIQSRGEYGEQTRLISLRRRV